MKEKDLTYWQELQQINLLLGGRVIEIILEDDKPVGVQLNFQQLEQNFTLNGRESPVQVQQLFRRHAAGLTALTKIAELDPATRRDVRLQLWYTQVLLGLLSLLVKVPAK